MPEDVTSASPRYYERLGRMRLLASGFRSRVAETPVAPVHYYEADGGGDLPPAVLLHGLSSSATPLAPLLKRVRRHCERIIAPDAPGHGFSGLPDDGPLTMHRLFEAVRDALDKALDRPAVVFGNSMGGGAAIRFALERPEKVLGLVLCSPAGAPLPPVATERFLSQFRMRHLADAQDFMARLYWRRPTAAPFVARELQRLMGRPTIQRLLDTVTPADFLDPADLARLTMPILLIWGRSDRIMRREHLAWFKRHLPPHARVLEPRPFGHSPYLEFPGSMARMITAFMREVASTRAPGGPR